MYATQASNIFASFENQNKYAWIALSIHDSPARNKEHSVQHLNPLLTTERLLRATSCKVWGATIRCSRSTVRHTATSPRHIVRWRACWVYVSSMSCIVEGTWDWVMEGWAKAWAWSPCSLGRREGVWSSRTPGSLVMESAWATWLLPLCLLFLKLS
jgi:hypothetical protein